jgi:hypothetical protein
MKRKCHRSKLKNIRIRDINRIANGTNRSEHRGERHTHNTNRSKHSSYNNRTRKNSSTYCIVATQTTAIGGLVTTEVSISSTFGLTPATGFFAAVDKSVMRSLFGSDKMGKHLKTIIHM